MSGKPAAGILHQTLQADTVLLTGKIGLNVGDDPFSCINCNAGKVAELSGLAGLDGNTSLRISGE